MLKYKGIELTVYINELTKLVYELIVSTVFYSFLILLCWNVTIPDIIPGVKAMDYGQSFMVVLMYKLLTRSWNTDILKSITAEQFLTTTSLYNVALATYYVVYDKFHPKTENINTETNKL